jgi:hypothetical protein
MAPILPLSASDPSWAMSRTLRSRHSRSQGLRASEKGITRGMETKRAILSTVLCVACRARARIVSMDRLQADERGMVHALSPGKRERKRKRYTANKGPGGRVSLR